MHRSEFNKSLKPLPALDCGDMSPLSPSATCRGVPSPKSAIRLSLSASFGERGWGEVSSALRTSPFAIGRWSFSGCWSLAAWMFSFAPRSLLPAFQFGSTLPAPCSPLFQNVPISYRFRTDFTPDIPISYRFSSAPSSTPCPIVGAWTLELLWMLDVGAWMFFSDLRAHCPISTFCFPNFCFCVRPPSSGSEPRSIQSPFTTPRG